MSTGNPRNVNAKERSRELEREQEREQENAQLEKLLADADPRMESEAVEKVGEGEGDGMILLDLTTLDIPIRRQVTACEVVILKNVSQIGKSTLAIGKAIAEVHELLEPMRLFNSWLKRMPWLATSTAYRYMGAYRRAKEGLSDAVLERAIAGGISLLGYSPDRPWGAYTEAVKRLPEAPTDPEEADKWITALKTEKRKLAKQSAKGDVMQRLATSIARAYHRHGGEEDAARWLKRLELVALRMMRTAKGLDRMERLDKLDKLDTAA